MTKEEAYILLSFHSCKNNDIEMRNGKMDFLVHFVHFKENYMSVILSR